MKIALWTLEKPKKNKNQLDIEDFAKRITHYAPFELFSLDNSKIANAKSSQKQIMQQEAKLILSKLKDSDHLILFDERGEGLRSEVFAQQINKWQVANIQQLIFLIGGSFGVSNEIRQRANGTISLSKLTLPHRIVKLVATEQIYRAFTILKGEKYHHD